MSALCKCGQHTERKFCSYKCYWKSLKGKAPKNTEGLELGRGWNKGIFKDKVKYNSVHRWLQRNYKKQGICEFCGDVGKTEWASKYKMYTRDIKEYLELCKSCHNYQDRATSKRVDVYAYYKAETTLAVMRSA